MGEVHHIRDRDLGNGVYQRASVQTSTQIIDAVNPKPIKRQTLSWSDDAIVDHHVNDTATLHRGELTPLNGTTNHGFSKSNMSSSFLEIPSGTLQNGKCSSHQNRHSYPQNFYLRRHSDYIELMKNRRLESLRKNAEIKQRTEMSTSLIEQFSKRDKPFRSTLDYYSVVLTFVIGLGNVLRFSYLCHQNGGGAFFIPYFVMLFFEGIPLACLEMAVGQRYGKSSLFKAWSNLVPCLVGVGLSAFSIIIICLSYYNVMVSWCLYFAVQSLRDPILWEPCNIKTNKTFGRKEVNEECVKSGSEKYFWYRESLKASDDINQFSGLNMFMYLFVVLSWLTCFLLSMKLLRKTAKVYLVILLFIIINLMIFFFVAVELDGWAEGLSMLFTVESLDSLKDINVWMEAAGQILFSLSIGWGGLIIFSSRNKWNNNFCSDALFISIANSATSVWASIIMFSFFGFRMNFQVKSCQSLVSSNDTKAIEEFMMKVNIEGSQTPFGLANGSRNCSKRFFFDQIPGGMSMAFIGMTQAFGEMESSSTYACLFFLLLFMLGITSLPIMIEIIINSCFEWKLAPKKFGREIIAGVICLLLCLINLINVQPTGLYILELIDKSSAFPLLVLGFFECIGVCYIYGIEKFSKDIFVMTGKKISWKWKFCWMFVSPLIILGLIIGSIANMVKNGELTYKAWSRDKGHLVDLSYPPWASFLYILLKLLPVVCLVYPLLKALFQKLQISNICQGTLLSCGLCKAITEAIREKLGERSGTYDLTSPNNLIGCENNSFEMNGVHSDDIFESEATNSINTNGSTSNSRDSSFHSNHKRTNNDEHL